MKYALPFIYIMKFTESDKIEIENLIKLINRSSFDKMMGKEALALARAYQWLENLLKECNKPEPQPIMLPVQTKTFLDEPEQEPVKKLTPDEVKFIEEVNSKKKKKSKE